MRRKNKLPDSLELLLDTMCNTFGAIMFIAISLVIISQVTTKIIKDKKPLEITEEYLENMRQQARKLEEELASEEVKRAQRALAAIGMPESKRKLVEKLLEAKADNQSRVLDIAQQKADNAKLDEEVAKAQQKLFEAQEELRLLENENKQLKKMIAQTLLAHQARKKKLEEQIRQLKEEMASLNKELQETPKQTLAFSMETSTEGQRQYSICLKEGRLYREVEDEVKAERPIGKAGRFVFYRGNAVREDAEGTFRSLLGDVEQTYFVTVFCDSKSYWILVELRKYLRKRGIKMNFVHTEDFLISFGNDVRASY
ncbi:MAG: hypothetical protein IJS08_06130 [Victivallales bacterium]|nr:hypothetical protein [Victivallales bacterium]